MGLNNSAAKVLSGVKLGLRSFGQVAMLGRQDLVADSAVLKAVYKLHGVVAPTDTPYAEAFFEALGAEVVHSFDASEFEGATHIHDLNTPLPDTLKGNYTLVFDGGTLEHIFNIPQALKNVMEMMEIGGVFVQEVPANNQMGHGFWQFCPEYAYRVFSKDYGFETVAVLVQEVGQPFYLARDPKELGWRVQLQNQRATSLTVIARKTAKRAIFDPPPQQSDYSAAWGGSVHKQKRRIIDRVRRFVPSSIERAVRPTFANKAHIRLSDAQVMRGQFQAIDI